MSICYLHVCLLPSTASGTRAPSLSPCGLREAECGMRDAGCWLGWVSSSPNPASTSCFPRAQDSSSCSGCWQRGGSLPLVTWTVDRPGKVMRMVGNNRRVEEAIASNYLLTQLSPGLAMNGAPALGLGLSVSVCPCLRIPHDAIDLTGVILCCTSGSATHPN